MFAATPALRTRIGVFAGLGSCQLVMSDKELPQWTDETSDLHDFLARDKTNHMGYGDALCRFAMVQEPHDGSRFVVWTVHHAVSDGQVAYDVSRIVEEAYVGDPMHATTPFNQFVRYVRERDAKAARDFWKAQFSGLGAEAKFPRMDEAHEPRLTRYLERSVAVPNHRSTGGGSGYTPSLLLRASWALVLSHAAGGASDVVIASRSRAATSPCAASRAAWGPR